MRGCSCTSRRVGSGGDGDRHRDPGAEHGAREADHAGGLIAEHTGGQSVETIEKDSDRDRWFTAEEARDYGFVDRVVEHLDDVRPDVTRKAGGL